MKKIIIIILILLLISGGIYLFYDFNKEEEEPIKEENTSKIEEPIKDGLITDNEAKAIYKALLKKLETNEKVIDYLDNKYKIDNTSKLLRSQYAEIIRENK